MIILFPCYVLTLVLTALTAVLAPPGRLLAAPVADYPRLWLRAFSFDLPALWAWLTLTRSSRHPRFDPGTPVDAADDDDMSVRTIPRFSHA